MPTSGYGGYYPYRPPTTSTVQTPGGGYQPTTQLPIPAPAPAPMPTTYTLPPPPPSLPPIQQTPLPPAPQMPTLPAAPPNEFLSMLQSLIGQFQTTQPFAQLGPEIMALLGQGKAAALAGFEDTKTQALDQQLASLFGRGVPQSSIALDEAGRLSTGLGAARAQIEADAAAKQLAAMQYAGQFGQQNLSAMGSLAGTGASLSQGAYRDQINALLQQAGLNLQSYGQQSGNALQQQQLAQNYALGQGGLNQQAYGTQTGNMLQQQQLSQQYQLAQQQMQQSLLQSLLGNLGSFGSYGSTGGTSGGTGFNFGGFGGSTSGTPSAGTYGYYPGSTPNPTAGPTGQDIQQLIYSYIAQLLGG